MADSTPLPTLSTKLDAVNVILSAIGECPVSALTGTVMDAANAQNVLEEVIREVQIRGWHFNSDDAVPLTPDGDGYIILPSNVATADVDPLDYPDIDPVLRGNQLYDRKAHTYTFTSAIKADLTYILDWVKLPEHARRYITIRASRLFADRYLGSDTVHQFTKDDEVRALMDLKGQDDDDADYSIFDSPDIAIRRSRY